MEKEQDSKISIRHAERKDIVKLSAFFVRAYGDLTIFKDEDFLEYYFGFEAVNKKSPFKSLIAQNENGEIISHYGGLFYPLRINHTVRQMVWGVSAYTLPEWRGKGLNSRIVNFLAKKNEINGVIGFKRETALFYEKAQYNLFQFKRFDRFLQILDFEKTLEIIDFIGQDISRFKELFQNQSVPASKNITAEVKAFNTENFRNYEIALDEFFPDLTTTSRTAEFLTWRFFENPFIQYKVFGYIKDGKVISYLALREEVLEPFNYKVCRIIDLFGNRNGVKSLLENAIQFALQERHLYLDFSVFGYLYENELLNSGFIKLAEEDYSLVPQLTAPLANKSNNEYLGIQSEILSNELRSLIKKSVYFTRMDSDRDRLAKITQLPAKNPPL